MHKQLVGVERLAKKSRCIARTLSQLLAVDDRVRVSVVLSASFDLLLDAQLDSWDHYVSMA